MRLKSVFYSDQKRRPDRVCFSRDCEAELESERLRQLLPCHNRRGALLLNPVVAITE